MVSDMAALKTARAAIGAQGPALLAAVQSAQATYDAAMQAAEDAKLALGAAVGPYSAWEGDMRRYQRLISELDREMGIANIPLPH